VEAFIKWRISLNAIRQAQDDIAKMKLQTFSQAEHVEAFKRPRQAFLNFQDDFINYFINSIEIGYMGISPLLTLIAFKIGKTMATIAIPINKRIPRPNKNINGIQMME